MTKPLQVYLEDVDAERLETWARQRGWTKSQAVRAAIRALTHPPAEDPVLELSGMFHGAPRDLSANFDRYLKETYVAERAPTYAPRQRGRAGVRRQRPVDRRQPR
jgi:hypothetical protein